MTDFNEQVMLAEKPVFTNGFANGEQAPWANSSGPIIDARVEAGTVEKAIPTDGGELANEPEILRCLADDLELAGLAGEKRTAQVVFLAATSRLLSQPLSVAVKGPSSGGKSYTVQNALRFLPQEACFSLTSASEKAR